MRWASVPIDNTLRVEAEDVEVASSHEACFLNMVVFADNTDEISDGGLHQPVLVDNLLGAVDRLLDVFVVGSFHSEWSTVRS